MPFSIFSASFVSADWIDLNLSVRRSHQGQMNASRLSQAWLISCRAIPCRAIIHDHPMPCQPSQWPRAWPLIGSTVFGKCSNKFNSGCMLYQRSSFAAQMGVLPTEFRLYDNNVKTLQLHSLASFEYGHTSGSLRVQGLESLIFRSFSSALQL